MNTPYHLAIIPDGNRRWAQANGLKAWIGHQYGTETFKKILRAAFDLKIPYISFWGSSEDNIRKRSPIEIKFLLNIFKKKFAELASDKNIHQNRVRINIIGDWRKQFPEDVKKTMEQAIELTKDYNNFFLNFFIAYSGKNEIMQAIKAIAKKEKGNAEPNVTPKLLKQNLLTKDLPPVDYLIRTGGEPHNSDGFMMWDMADAQLYFYDKPWPDFTAMDLKEAIKEFDRRQRRFGA